MQAVNNTFPRPHSSYQTKKIVFYLQRAWGPFGILDVRIGLIPPYPHRTIFSVSDATHFLTNISNRVTHQKRNQTTLKGL